MKLDPRIKMRMLLAATIVAMVAISSTAAMYALGIGSALGKESETDGYTLFISGFVENEFSLTMLELKSMPNVTVTAELICVSGHTFGIHNWKGVRLGTLLDMGSIKPGAVKVAFNASDGYRTDLNMSDALRDDVMIAYEKDGAPMDEIVRLIVPGKWGYKWVHHLKGIAVVDFDFKGNYESTGYSDDAEIPPGFVPH